MPLPITDTLRAQLARFLKSEHSRTIVHGYKELLHLLGAVDLDMDLPMFDTKLAGYLAQPDFHADSLKQAAEHFLDIHFTETEQPSQGTLDFDDDQVEEDPNEHRLRDLAIIRSLAVTLGPIIDEREQCWLMRAIELPVSRVLHGMEHTGAKSIAFDSSPCVTSLPPRLAKRRKWLGSMPAPKSTCKAPSSCRRCCSKIWV